MSKWRNWFWWGALLLVVNLFGPVKVMATDYYVATTGNNSNPGTAGQPLLTVQKAVDVVAPGDTIFLRAGTYNENVTISTAGNVTNPIILKNYSGETATIDGGGNPAIKSASNSTAAYWTIDGLVIKGGGRYTIQLGWWGETTTSHITVKNNQIFGASFSKTSYSTWDNNIISGVGYTGTNGDAGIGDGDKSSYNTYSNNIIHDFTQYDGRGIWSQGNTHDDLITNNTIYNITGNMGQCIDLDGAGTVEWRHEARGNTVYNCGYVGVQLENVFASVIENNKINAGPAGLIDINYNSGVGCTVGGESNQYGDTNGDNNCRGDVTNNVVRQNVIWTSTNWGWGYGGIVNWYVGGLKIWGNTIYAPGSSGNGGINFQGTASDTGGASIKNNIVVNGNGTAICALDYGSFTDDQNNLLYKTNNNSVYATGASCDTSSTLAAYQAATGNGQNSLFGDPLFINPGIQNFSIGISSPAVNNGIDVGSSTDFIGNHRPSGSGYDIGAYEFQWLAPTDTPVPTATATPTPTPTPIIVAPGIPTGVGATASDQTVHVWWTTPISDGGAAISDYQVDYKLSTQDTSFWTSVGHVASTEPDMFVIGLTNGLSYDFMVSAVNTAGVGQKSVMVSATPTSPILPTATPMPTATPIRIGATEIQSQFGGGVLVISVGSSIVDTSKVTVNNELIIGMGETPTQTAIDLQKDTEITRLDGQNFDASQLSAQNMDKSLVLNLSSGFSPEALMRWGVAGLTLSFNKPVTINLYVGEDKDGATLTVLRSPSTVSGWVSDGIVNPATCVVANGICSFSTTEASYFTAASYKASVSDQSQTSSNNNSNSSGPPGPPGCGDSPSSGKPDLYEITTSKLSATLAFAPPTMPYSNFYVAYSTNPNSWDYGVQFNQGYSAGTVKYTINDLKPNTKYYFKIRSGNGCATGDWGNTMAAKTNSQPVSKLFYKNTLIGIVQTTQKIIQTFTAPIKKVTKKSAEIVVLPKIPNITEQMIPDTPVISQETLPAVTQTIKMETPAPPTPTPITKKKFCVLWWCF